MTNRIWPFALFIATTLAPWVSHASQEDAFESSLPLSGRVFSDIYLPTRDIPTAGYRQSSASVWLQGDPKLGENGFSRFILTGDAIDTGSGASFRTGLREGYLGYAKNGYEFRIGRQIVPWGKSDVLNPTDFLSAKDYTLFNPDEEVRRLGSTMLWLNWTPDEGNSPLNFTFVAVPVFAQSRLLVAPTTIPANSTVATTAIAPPQTISNTETAFKAAYFGSSWDVSLSVFRGFNHMPEYALTSVTGSGATLVANFTPISRAIRAVGSDASFTSGKWVFRGESAYVWTQNDTGTNPTIQPSHWDSVVGVERPFGDDFRLQAQFVSRYHPNFTPPDQAGGADPVSAAINPQLARANALLLNYQDRFRPGATLRLSYTNETNGIDTELFLMGNVIGGDYLIRPKFSYNWTDAIKTTIGTDYYGGPADRPLGALKAFNSVFIEGKYSF